MNNRHTPILLYHDIESPDCPNDKTGPAAQDTVVHADNFAAQVVWLVNRHYTTMKLSELIDATDSGKDEVSRKIMITFDDGHHSNYKLAYPILSKHNLTATFFIIADRIDRPGYLTAKQIREMANHGMEIGSHGWTHRFFPLLSDTELERELRDSKNKLADITGQAIDFLAFPGGHYDRRVLAITKSCGYAGACSCLYGLNKPDTDPFRLRRMEVRRQITLEDFARYFKNGDQFIYKSVNSLKTLVKCTIGLERYATLRAYGYRYYFFKK